MGKSNVFNDFGRIYNVKNSQILQKISICLLEFVWKFIGQFHLHKFIDIVFVKTIALSEVFTTISETIFKLWFVFLPSKANLVNGLYCLGMIMSVKLCLRSRVDSNLVFKI